MLRRVLDPALVRSIDHIGSTAIPGIPAKPIIDIAIATPSIERARAAMPTQLAGLGYIFWDENPDRSHLFFVKGMPPFGERRTHHVHVRERGGDQEIAFRDHLRGHPQEASRYADLKRRIAAAHRHDREAYTAAKGAYVAEILAAARRPRASIDGDGH